MHKILVQQRQLSPGELSYQKRAAAWYKRQEAKRSPAPKQRPTHHFNTGITAPKRIDYGAIWLDEND